MRLAIAGAGGKMGRMLIEAVAADPDLELAAAFDVPGSPAIGTRVGAVAVGTDPAAAIAAADALVDFTRPEGTMAHLEACLAAGKPIVIGTTGFSRAQRAAIEQAAARIPVMLSPNYAVGVNVVFRLAEIAARALGEAWDVEILEAHHRQKVDAPSGTALELGRIVARALGRELEAVAVHGRRGETGARSSGEIGFHAIRGGDIVGEHTVLFAGSGERLEITVRSASRMSYALGALRAAKWLRGRPPGLYDCFDALGLRQAAPL
ncbi:MAG: 4-hydroxy-tetrahydrodipicolinate reductase [Burkholderiales bacterium]|nr:4-hydroxy-tetrahydrodipicolinate reductase [Burkholderiales bacterium]